MCGICGIIKDNILENDLDQVKKMNDKLIHRGPDDEGYFNDDKVTMAMRRLSIIDLEGGRQPLFNEDNSIVLIANAEIYNFVELRKELENKGHIFRTNTDCETIIHAYEEYREDFFKKLRGMFAFCLYDKNNNIVILARDRMAEKPLYYCQNEKSFVFSSEMKSIIQIVKNPTINYKALDFFLTCQYVNEPLTLINQVQKLEAAHYVIYNLKNNSFTIKKYWDPYDCDPITKNPENAIKESLEDIMKIIIRSDVPIGVSLSGGLDSSIVAVLANKYSHKKIHAFTVGYPGRPHNDERLKAKKLTDNFGMPLHEIELTTESLIKNFPEMVYDMDDPIGDIAAYGYYQVIKAARRENIPVLFSGIGSDEIFWGYSWVSKAAEYAINFYKNEYFFYHKLLTFFQQNNLHNKHIFSLLQPNFHRQKLIYKKLYTARFKEAINEEILERIDLSAERSISARIITELFNLWLYPNCNTLNDRLSMSSSIELRSPYLDYLLVEKAIGISINNPAEHKLPPKQRLKDAVRDLVPAEILKRKKRGFEPPVPEWQSAIIKNYIDICFNGYMINEKLIVCHALKDIVKKSLSGDCRRDNFLYRLIIFELWCKKYLPKCYKI